MKKMFLFISTLVAFLTMFAASTAAAGGGETIHTISPYEGPLLLLAILTLAFLIFLPFKDHN